VPAEEEEELMQPVGAGAAEISITAEH